MYAAFSHHAASVNPGARAEIDNMIGAADRLLVVFDHHHRIAQIPQVKQRIEQTLIVPLVKSDGGFIKNVHHSHQPGTDL